MSVNLSKSCGGQVVRYYRPEADHVKVLVFRPRCKAWRCPDCAKEKAGAIIKRLRPFIEQNKTYMYTFTFDNSLTAEETWRRMPKIWNLWRTRISQQFGKFQFCRVVEAHKNRPYPHLHVIANVNIPECQLGRITVECGFGYQLKKVPVTSDNAAFYVSKYLTKPWENEDAAYLREKLGVRIVSFSRGFTVEKPPKPTNVWAVTAPGSLLTPDQYSSVIEREFGVNSVCTLVTQYKRGYSFVVSRVGASLKVSGEQMESIFFNKAILKAHNPLGGYYAIGETG